MNLLPIALVFALTDSPFACDRSALTPEVRKHHFEEVVPALRKLVKSHKELPAGYAFELPAENASILLAAEFTANERLCCPFLDITLRIEREHGKVCLELTGRAGTKDFIREDFARWF